MHPTRLLPLLVTVLAPLVLLAGISVKAPSALAVAPAPFQDAPAAPEELQDPDSDRPEVTRFRLDNGLTVLVLPDRQHPLVNLTAVYSVGGAHEEAGITGLAHYVEHMAFRSTENFSNVDLTGVIERIGGRWNGYTTLDRTLYGATVPSWALESVIEIEADRMARTNFDPDEFERERTSVVAELQGGENAAAILREKVNAHAFELHPYRTGVIGRITDLLGVTPEEGEHFYRQYYGPNNAVLVVVGDVEPGQVWDMVTRSFGTLEPAPRSTAIRVLEPPQLGEKRVEITYPASTAHLRIAYRAPDVFHPDYPSLVLLDAVLTGRGGVLQPGGSALPGSRLRAAVEAAGGLGVATQFAPTRYPGLYTVSVQVPDPSDIESVEQAIHAEMEGFPRAGIGREEREAAVRTLRNAAAFEATDLRETAHRLAVFELLGDWQLADSLLEAAARRSEEDLQAYAAAWFVPHQRTVGVHRPGPRLAEEVHVPVPDVPPIALPTPSPVPEEALRPIPTPDIAVASREAANGAAVVAARHDGPVAALRLRMSFGSEGDPTGLEGLALLTGRLIAEHPALSDVEQRLGARVQTSATDAFSMDNREYLDLSIRFLPRDRSDILLAVGTALGDFPIDPDRFAGMRRDQQGRIARVRATGRWQARESVLERTIDGWRSPLGTPESMADITVGDANEFLARHLKPGSLVIALASPDDPDVVATETAQVLESLSALGASPGTEGSSASYSGRRQVPSASGMASSSDPVLIPVAGESQAAIAAALPGVGRAHPDHLPLQLLNYILGETGYAGRLGSALVRNGLAYAVYATPELHRDDGSILVGTSTATATLDDALAAVREVLATLERDGVEDWEFREAQAFRIGRLAAGTETAHSLAHLLAEDLYFGRPLLDLPARSREILELSADRVREAAQAYLTLDGLVLAAAGAVEMEREQDW